MFLACTFLSALNKLYIIQNLKPEKSTSMFINYLVNSCGGTQKSTCQELALTRTASEWFWWKESSTTKEREICLWFCGNYKIMFENGGLETPKDMRLISSFITGPLSCGLLCNDVKHYDHLKYIYVFFFIYVGCPGQLTRTTTIPHGPLDILQAQEQVRHRGGDRCAYRGSNPGRGRNKSHDWPQQLDPQVQKREVMFLKKTREYNYKSSKYIQKRFPVLMRVT